MVWRRIGRGGDCGGFSAVGNERIAVGHVRGLRGGGDGAADRHVVFCQARAAGRGAVMNAPLTREELDALRKFSTPTISNALERLGVGFAIDNQSDSSIRCIFPELGAVVGYAVTATIASAEPCASPKYQSRRPYWEH